MNVNDKFIIIEREDVDKHLPLHDIVDLGHICKQIKKGREKEGKKDNAYLVITDERTLNFNIGDLVYYVDNNWLSKTAYVRQGKIQGFLILKDRVQVVFKGFNIPLKYVSKNEEELTPIAEKLTSKGLILIKR